MPCDRSMTKLHFQPRSAPDYFGYDIPYCEGELLATRRRHNAEQKIMLYTGVAYAVMAAWSIFTQTTAGTQPLIASTIIGGASNVYKLQQIFPPGPSEAGNASGEPHPRSPLLLMMCETGTGVIQHPEVPSGCLGSAIAAITHVTTVSPRLQCRVIREGSRHWQHRGLIVTGLWRWMQE